MGVEDEVKSDKVRRRKHRSSSSKDHRSRSSSRRHGSGSGSGSRRSHSRREGAGSGTAKEKLPVATAAIREEDVEEGLDFDPSLDPSKPSSRMSKHHKSLRENPDVIEENMQENIFSLIYVSPVLSGAFWYALVVALFQLALPFLALLDLIVMNDDDENFLQLPKNVSIQVRVLAAMVLILAVVQFWDLMEAVENLQKGPPPSKSDIPEGAKKWKFYMSYTIQMIMGALFEVAVFVFIMQSTTILDVFLNFAALEFITSVDEFAFSLAKKGYISNAVKQSCDEVSGIRILRRKGGRVCRRIQMIFFIFAMLTGYAVLSNWQNRGKFDCEKIEVQFGDGFITILPVFSGEYSYTKTNQKDDDKRLSRPVYWDKQRGAAFRYCLKGDSGAFSFAQSGYWVFGFLVDDVKNIDDICDNFVSRSPETKGFDLLEFPGSAWETKRRLDDTVLYNVDYFQLRCGDCEDETCNGKCEDNTCICQNNQFGYNCQFRDAPCPKTDYDRRTKPFRGVGDFFSSKYSLLTTVDTRRNLTVPFYSYNRPVYAFVHTNGFVDLLINFGRRYFLFDILGFNIEGAVQGSQTTENGVELPLINTTALVENFTNFHPWYNWIKPLYADGGIVNATGEKAIYRLPVFVSDPIDVGTQSDSLSPLGLAWRRVKKLILSKRNYFDLFSLGSRTETVLLCSRCSDSSPCLNGGTCLRNNKTCHCPTPSDFDDDQFFQELQSEVVYSGTLCELDCTEIGSDNVDECSANFDFWADDDDFVPTDDDLFAADDDDDDDFPTDDGNTPDDDGNTPDDDGNTPDDDGNTPDDDGNAPDDDGATPDDDPANPTDDGNAPDDDGATPDDDGNAPEDDGATPDDDGNTPNDDGAAPDDDGNNPNDDGNNPNDDGAAPDDDGNNPNDDGNNPNDDGNNPNDDGNNPNDDGNNPNDDGNNPNDDGNNPNDDGNNPNDDGNNPNDDGNNPNDDGNNPNDDGGNFPNDDGNNPNDDGGNFPNDDGNNPNDDDGNADDPNGGGFDDDF